MLTLTNSRDAGRKLSTAGMAPKVITEAEGSVIEKITGPIAGGTVILLKPATAVVHVQAYVTATGAWAAVPNLTQGVDYDVQLRDANGVCALTEKLAVDYSTTTWIVQYKRDEPDAPVGNQWQVSVGGAP